MMLTMRTARARARERDDDDDEREDGRKAYLVSACALRCVSIGRGD